MGEHVPGVTRYWCLGISGLWLYTGGEFFFLFLPVFGGGGLGSLYFHRKTSIFAMYSPEEPYLLHIFRSKSLLYFRCRGHLL